MGLALGKIFISRLAHYNAMQLARSTTTTVKKAVLQQCCMHSFHEFYYTIDLTLFCALAVCSCALRRIVKLPVVEGSFSW